MSQLRDHEQFCDEWFEGLLQLRKKYSFSLGHLYTPPSKSQKEVEDIAVITSVSAPHGDNNNINSKQGAPDNKAHKKYGEYDALAQSECVDYSMGDHSIATGLKLDKSLSQSAPAESTLNDPKNKSDDDCKLGDKTTHDENKHDDTVDYSGAMEFVSDNGNYDDTADHGDKESGNNTIANSPNVSGDNTNTKSNTNVNNNNSNNNNNNNNNSNNNENISVGVSGNSSVLGSDIETDGDDDEEDENDSKVDDDDESDNSMEMNGDTPVDRDDDKEQNALLDDYLFDKSGSKNFQNNINSKQGFKEENKKNNSDDGDTGI